MLITAEFAKFTVTEIDEMIVWALKVLMKKDADVYGGIQIVSDRLEQKEDKLKHHVVILLQGMIVSKYDLHKERFDEVVALRDRYLTQYGFDQPEWFFNETKRSSSREQWRGIDDQAEKHQVRSQYTAERIKEIALQMDANEAVLMIKLPGMYGFIDELIEKWRQFDRNRSKEKRARRSERKAIAKQAVAKIDDVDTLRRELELANAKNLMLQEQVRRLRGAADRKAAYAEAKTESHLWTEQHHPEITKLLAENIEQGVQIEAGFKEIKRLHTILKLNGIAGHSGTKGKNPFDRATGMRPLLPTLNVVSAIEHIRALDAEKEFQHD